MDQSLGALFSEKSVWINSAESLPKVPPETVLVRDRFSQCNLEKIKLSLRNEISNRECFFFFFEPFLAAENKGRD